MDNCKKNKFDKFIPKVSVVTVVFNGELFIEKTILSVLDQKYPNLEYIVIDGGSTDGTPEIIKKYTDSIDFFCSESDLGIYDAMNKGLSRASGDWINFMNAGDVFYSDGILIDIFINNQQSATVIYGGVQIVYPDLIRIQKPGAPRKMWQGMQFSHQSAFVNVVYHQAHPFRIGNKIAADLEFFYQAYLDHANFSNCNTIVSRVITGGVSERNRIRAIRSTCDAICGKKLRLLIRLFFIFKIFNSIFKSFLKATLPRFLIRKIILLK